MRIAMLAPISWRTPPRHYGPWELVTSLLTEGLVQKGMDVTLFATKDSITKAKLRAVAPCGYSEDAASEPKVWECLHISNVFEHADEFDLIHNQFDFLPLTYSGLVKTPVVTTIHGFSSPNIVPVYEKYNKTCNYVSISNADRNPKLDYMATIYHGIAMDEFAYTPEPEDYLLFFGRIHSDKGVWEAIQLAKKTKSQLIIAGIIQDQKYFDEKVAPFFEGEQIKFIGPVARTRRSEVLGKAKAILHLINFDEPFGMTVIEGMACGTPVIAISRGAMPELIRDGETGFLIPHWQAGSQVISEIPKIKRESCREWIQKCFTQQQMVNGYLDVYNRILNLER
ncbi:MAG: glycosyltransferase family 4 protein [bacterium]